MKKNVMIVVGDYWHHKETIDPLIPLLFDDEWNVNYTANPNELLSFKEPLDLFVSFKDPIENDQIPTPIWCDDEWTEYLEKKIRDGMGFLNIHCGVTDVPEGHRMVTEINRAFFINHPKKCPVSFVPKVKHPILEGIDEFTFPMNDEHYMMKFYKEYPTTILGMTVSQHGGQPGLWTHNVGKGRVCCVTPGHYTENITYPPYLKLLQNAVNWCKK